MKYGIIDIQDGVAVVETEQRPGAGAQIAELAVSKETAKKLEPMIGETVELEAYKHQKNELFRLPKAD